jgi:hypothetical protein
MSDSDYDHSSDDGGKSRSRLGSNENFDQPLAAASSSPEIPEGSPASELRTGLSTAIIPLKGVFSTNHNPVNNKKKQKPRTKQDLESHKKSFLAAVDLEERKLKLVYILISRVSVSTSEDSEPLTSDDNHHSDSLFQLLLKCHTEKAVHADANLLRSLQTSDKCGRLLLAISEAIAIPMHSFRGKLQYGTFTLFICC